MLVPPLQIAAAGRAPSEPLPVLPCEVSHWVRPWRSNRRSGGSVWFIMTKGSCCRRDGINTLLSDLGLLAELSAQPACVRVTAGKARHPKRAPLKQYTQP